MSQEEGCISREMSSACSLPASQGEVLRSPTESNRERLGSLTQGGDFIWGIDSLLLF